MMGQGGGEGPILAAIRWQLAPEFCKPKDAKESEFEHWERFKAMGDMEIVGLDRQKEGNEWSPTANQRIILATGIELLNQPSSSAKRYSTLLNDYSIRGAAVSEPGAGYQGYHMAGMGLALLTSERRSWKKKATRARLLLRHNLAWVMCHGMLNPGAKGRLEIRQAGVRRGSMTADGWAATEAMIFGLPSGAGKNWFFQGNGTILWVVWRELEQEGIVVFEPEEKDLLRAIASGRASRGDAVQLLAGMRLSMDTRLAWDHLGGFISYFTEEVPKNHENVVYAACCAGGVGEDLRAWPVDEDGGMDSWNKEPVRVVMGPQGISAAVTGFSKRDGEPKNYTNKRIIILNRVRGERGAIEVTSKGLIWSGGLIPGLEKMEEEDAAPPPPEGEKPVPKPEEPQKPLNWNAIGNQVEALSVAVESFRESVPVRDRQGLVEKLELANLQGRAERLRSFATGKLK